MSKEKVKKFTKEQLSMILSHAPELQQFGGRVRNYGDKDCEVGCVNQCAYNEPNAMNACVINEPVAEAFDRSMRATAFTPTAILRLLERVGAA